MDMQTFESKLILTPAMRAPCIYGNYESIIMAIDASTPSRRRAISGHNGVSYPV